MGAKAEFSRQLALMARCEAIGHPDAYWVRRIVSNAGQHLQYWCDTCRRPVTTQKYGGEGQSRTAAWLLDELGITAETLPEIRTDVRYTICARCLETLTCEMHHVAPQAAFADADEWPKVPLCPQCHGDFTRGLEEYVLRRINAALRARRAS